jgi:tetratricopeptide (TPR) repeat protein
MAGIKKHELSSTYGIATAYIALGQPERAIELYQRFPEAQDSNSIYSLDSYQNNRAKLTSLGIAYWLTGRYEDATKIYLERSQGGNDFPVDYSLAMIGRKYIQTAKYKDAIALYETKLKKSKEANDSVTQIGLLANLAGIYGRLGDYSKAVKAYEKCLDLAEKSDMYSQGWKWKALIWSDLGQIHLRKGDDPRIATQFFEKALPLIRKMNQELVINRENIYDSYRVGDIITQKIVLSHWESKLLSDTGSAYLKLKEYGKAFALLNSSLSIARAVSDREMESEALGIIGSADSNLKRISI